MRNNVQGQGLNNHLRALDRAYFSRVPRPPRGSSVDPACECRVFLGHGTVEGAGTQHADCRDLAHGPGALTLTA